MSASLVGSEMCIRDSTQTPSVSCGHFKEPAQLLLQLWGRGPAAPPPRGPCLLYTSDAADDM
eukprot:13290398-Alexandrium_andersonii.AAC.1